MLRLRHISSQYLSISIFSVIIILIILLALPITIFQLQKPQEVKTRAQVATCSSLTYPCQEGQLSFPGDEGKHDTNVDWWYANFNTVSTSLSLSAPLAGAVALVRIKQADGSDKGYALLEITSEWSSQFYYRVLTGKITAQAGAQNVSFIADPGTEVNTIMFYQTEQPFQYKFVVTGNGIDIDITLSSTKKPLVEGGTGYVQISPNYTDRAYYSGYYSLTQLTMNTNKSIILPQTPAFTATGIGWIDHQWFNIPSALLSLLNDPFKIRPHHEWFSIQLDNNVQIVAWEIYQAPGTSQIVLRNLDIIDSSGNQKNIIDAILDPRAYWSALDGKKFAHSWRLYKQNEFDLTIVTSIQNQYVKDALTYEGSANISGTYKGTNIRGQGYAEMTLTYNSSCIPSSEICDGRDNDCDYLIDEFCPTSPPANLSPPPTSTPTPIPTPTLTPTPLPPPGAVATNTPTPASTLNKLGDIDGNGIVDIFDFNEVIGFFGRVQTNPYLDADLDQSGEVDIFDFNEVIANFIP